jgi:hypothetical protein
MNLKFPWWGILVVASVLSVVSRAQTAAAPATRKHAHPAAASAATQEDVQALRDLVQSQQKQIEAQGQQMQQLQDQLHQVLDAVQQANTNSQKGQSGAEQAQATAIQAQQSATEAQHAAADASTAAASAASADALLEKENKKEQTQLKGLADLAGRFRFSGDVRVRFENYTQDGTQDRNRARIRVRLGLEGQLNQDFLGGVALATGSQGDPTTTNETLTNAFDRKTIALDKGFITYNPVAHNWLSLTGGKFPYLWQRTPVTGDVDVNPEGFDQKLSFDTHGFVKNFTVQAFELLYGESSSSQDSYTLGGQASAKFEAGPWSATASFLTEHWNRPDALLQESAFAVGATTTGSTTAGSFPVPGEGPGCATNGTLSKFPPCAFAANGMTNSVYFDATGKPHFYSGFDYADFILNNVFKTGSSRFPVNLLLEFEDNLDAAAHPLSAATGNPVLTNLGSQNKEYGGDLSVGQTKNKNDFQIGYSWYRQEQDSVLASIAESDQRAPTNILQNKFYAGWKVRPNTVANFTWWYGRVLNTNLENNAALFNNWGGASSTITTAGQQEPWLNRLQFDLIYTY